jgi:hypothetical protein
MKERPILMNEQSIGPILDGRKTQTRRVITPQPVVGDEYSVWTDCKKWGNAVVKFTRHGYAPPHSFAESIARHCPYGVPGDWLWVREAWATEERYDDWKPSEVPTDAALWYGKEYPYTKYMIRLPGKRRPSIFMCHWMSRITLEVTNVRVEQVQDISQSDAEAEGVMPFMKDTGGFQPNGTPCPEAPDYVEIFAHLWDSIYSDRGFGWSDNPWVWVVEFERIQ